MNTWWMFTSEILDAQPRDSSEYLRNTYRVAAEARKKLWPIVAHSALQKYHKEYYRSAAEVLQK